MWYINRGHLIEAYNYDGLDRLRLTTTTRSTALRRSYDNNNTVIGREYDQNGNIYDKDGTHGCIRP